MAIITAWNADLATVPDVYSAPVVKKINQLNPLYVGLETLAEWSDQPCNLDALYYATALRIVAANIHVKTATASKGCKPKMTHQELEHHKVKQQ